MNGSSTKSDNRIDRFQNAIRQKWKCRTDYIREANCDLSSHGKGMASVFELVGQLEKYPEAKQCFVWDSKDFRKGDNEVIIVFDVQVISDPKDLPRLAVWAWLTDTLVKDTDIYVKSEKWTKNQLHNNLVEFGSDSKSAGIFFVRERADGKIAVRIVQRIIKEGDYAYTSFCITQPAIERIESLPDSNLFTLRFIS